MPAAHEPPRRADEAPVGPPLTRDAQSVKAAPHAEPGRPEERQWQRPTVVALLWAGVLAAPMAFLLELVISFALVERACLGGNDAALLTISTAAIAIAVAGGLIAWRHFRAVGEDPRPRGEGVEQSSPRSTGHTLANEYRTDAPGAIGRSRFMAFAGMVVSAYFAVILLASLIPTLVLPICS